MSKGGSAKHRGPTRAGTSDTPAAIRRTLAAYARTPQLLAGLPEGERRIREQQLAHALAVAAKRSRASKVGWQARRVSDLRRIEDRLVAASEVGGEEALQREWEALSDRQREAYEAMAAAWDRAGRPPV